MRIHVSKDSDVPISKQLVAQIELLIATQELKPGDLLPSVRALAKRLEVHHNTVSQAYQYLVGHGYVSGRRGGRLAVRSLDEPRSASAHKDLDDLINETVQAARRHGYTLRQLRQRARELLQEEPPDHVLVVAREAEMQMLFLAELSDALTCPVERCSEDQLRANPGLASGALVLTHPALMPELLSILPKSQPSLVAQYSPVDEHIRLVQQLDKPSLIALFSVSQYVLEFARKVFVAATGNRHTVSNYVVTKEHPFDPGTADLAFCDWIIYRSARPSARGKRLIPYRIVSPECVEQIVSRMADAGVDNR